MTNQELNEAVGRKLGKIITVCECQEKGSWGHVAIDCGKRPDYCNSIAAAWEVVEHLRSKTDYFYFTLMSTSGMTVSLWSVKFSEFNPPFAGDLEGDAATAPMAICLAFLKLP